MTDSINISDFSYDRGLSIGVNSQSYTYLYGLSDFWQYLFQDTTSTNLLLEATSLQASDIYSKFIQLCTGLSLEDIGPSASNQIRLEILNTSPVLPSNIPVLGLTWVGGFTTISVGDISNFAVGDIIVLSNTVATSSVTTYNPDTVIDSAALNDGASTYIPGSTGWDGTFTITSISPSGTISYFQPANPGGYISGGNISTSNIGLQTYIFSSKINGARFITNRAFLPTIVLEEDVDYSVDPSTARITFAKPLYTYGFPSRTTSGILEYALWLSDVRYDEDLIYSQYPLMLGILDKKPNISNKGYRNFIYGLYYIYTSGPTLSIIEKGINILLGVPLARYSETVIGIQYYVSADQYVIITDVSSYTLPSGLPPSVAVGDALVVGEELSKWVEIQDYQSSGNWWTRYSVNLPAELMERVPPGNTRLISAGVAFPYDLGDGINTTPIDGSGDALPYISPNYAGYLMDTYLKYNTFLVKVNVTQSLFLSGQLYGSISSLLLRMKPSHTFPIYTFIMGDVITYITSDNIYTLLGSVTVGRATAITNDNISASVSSVVAVIT